MKAKREYVDYVRDILDAAEKAQVFVAGIDFEAFQANDEKVFAVTRALEIIGEASKKIPPQYGSGIQTYPGERWLGCATNWLMTTSGSICGGYGRQFRMISLVCVQLSRVWLETWKRNKLPQASAERHVQRDT